MKCIVLALVIVQLMHLQASGFQERNRTGNNRAGPPPGERGTWGVGINKDKGRGPQIRTEAQGRIYTSPKGNWNINAQGHHEFGKGRKPDYGVGVQVQGRFRRSTDDLLEDATAEEEQTEVRLKRSWAPGGGSYPGGSSNSGNSGKGGSWGVSVNKDKGRGPQIRTEAGGNVYSSPNGRVNVDAQGHHEMGKGRKPSYGGNINVHGKWKRDVDLESDLAEVTEYEASENREKRSPKQPGDRGTWGVSVNKDKGRGPQVRTEAQGNIYTSPKGNWNVHAGGHHEFGKGRKPDYGVGIGVQGRFRRSTDDVQEDVFMEEEEGELREKRSPKQPGDRGTWGVSVNKDKGRGPQVRTEAQGNIYTSPKGNWNVHAGGHHEFGKGRKPDYGVGIGVQGRFRRSIDDVQEDVFMEEEEGEFREKRSPKQPGDRGTWGVSVNKDKGRGPQVRTEAQGNIYTSPKGNWNVHAGGHHEFGKGRKPDYGVGIGVQGRFRRSTDDAQEDVFEQDEQPEIRLKRSWAPGGGSFPGGSSSSGNSGKGGSWGVSVNKDKGRGPQIRTEAGGNVYSSPNGRVKVDAQGHHEMGKGRKPSYGGNINAHGKWKRDVDLSSELVEVPEDEASENRDKRSPKDQGDRGTWGVTVNKDKGRGPQVRTDAQGNIYTSPNGNWNVQGNGYHEFGRGRKPDYGVGVRVQGRWRRDANDPSPDVNEEPMPESSSNVQPTEAADDEDGLLERTRRNAPKTDVPTHLLKPRPMIWREIPNKLNPNHKGNFHIDEFGNRLPGRKPLPATLEIKNSNRSKRSAKAQQGKKKKVNHDVQITAGGTLKIKAH